MRSLAHDIGHQLGCGAHLMSLRRLRTGRFGISDALSIESAQRRFEDGSWTEALLSPDSALGDLRALVVGERDRSHIQNGRAVPLAEDIRDAGPDERFRAYSLDGEFLAILRLDPSGNSWRPDKVFSPSN